MSFISDNKPAQGGISARFPLRMNSPLMPSLPYTSAELRLYRYIQEVADNSDDHLAELIDAYARLAQFIGHCHSVAELDERMHPDAAPQPITPSTPASPGVPPCKGEPLSNEVCGGVGAAYCPCGE